MYFNYVFQLFVFQLLYNTGIQVHLRAKISEIHVTFYIYMRYFFIMLHDVKQTSCKQPNVVNYRIISYKTGCRRYRNRPPPAIFWALGSSHLTWKGAPDTCKRLPYTRYRTSSSCKNALGVVYFTQFTRSRLVIINQKHSLYFSTTYQNAMPRKENPL